ncbi:hypothetical protein C8Q75DRAFT_809418 [Abortiporus biennis]|nr:hypothetical protein C8Q75DRAFT_809418 [Abortiporus biennis]
MSAQKHVRFAVDPVSRTPSPSYSISSGTTESTITTPENSPKFHASPESVSSPYLSASPTVGPRRTHARTPSPLSLPAGQIPKGQQSLHQLLHASLHVSAPTAPFKWDVTFKPDSIHAYNMQLGSQYGFSEHLLHEAATVPTVPEMTIKSDLLPWVIQIKAVEPTRSNPKPFITVLDVLYAIYRSLRTPVKTTEMQAACAERPGLKKRIEDAFWARCRLAKDEQEMRQEQAKGIKRVDFLGDRIFAGLRSGEKAGQYYIQFRLS